MLGPRHPSTDRATVITGSDWTGGRGRIGWVRSRAWIWLFSSTPTPAGSRARVITDGVTPSLHVDYKHTRIKQYHKEGRVGPGTRCARVGSRRGRIVFVSCTPGVLSAYTVHGSDNDVVGFRLTVEQELVEVLSGGLLSAVWTVVLTGSPGVVS